MTGSKRFPPVSRRIKMTRPNPEEVIAKANPTVAIIKTIARVLKRAGRGLGFSFCGTLGFGGNSTTVLTTGGGVISGCGGAGSAFIGVCWERESGFGWGFIANSRSYSVKRLLPPGVL